MGDVMGINAKSILSVLVAAVVGGMAMYTTQFLTAGSSPASIQLMQVQRELVSTAILGLAAVVGYVTFEGHEIRQSAATVAAVFLLAGIVGYGTGFTALWVAPPDGFDLGSLVLPFVLVLLQEVIPFCLAGFAGVAVRAIG